MKGKNKHKAKPMDSQLPSSSYLGFGIYEDFPLSYLGFVEFHKGVKNTGKARVFYSFSVDINIQTGSDIEVIYSTQHAQLHLTPACFCSLPALKFRVIDVTKFLLAGV